jgi:uncharacterized protein YndB with AHSA1/START domain
MMTARPEINPETDLILERTVDVRPEVVWRAWTQPEHVKQWFTPKPWETIACEIDLRPGGRFSTTMRSPDGTEFPNVGCYLEIVPNRKLAWTDALLPGFRPSPEPFMSAVILLEPDGSGTRYTAIALHANAETRRKHEEMGFLDGWSTVLDQLVAYMKEHGGDTTTRSGRPS